MKQKKILIITIIALLVVIVGMSAWYNAYNQKKNSISSYDECVAAGYPSMESYPEQCAVPGGKTFTRVIIKGTSITLEGTTVCLPHKDMDGPHTMECAMGLKTDDGKYYGLSTDPYDSSLSVTDRRVRVTGTIKLGADTKYQREGTVTVTSYKFLN